jgi:hypothetical protein
MIEAGDWSEIRSELSDNSFAAFSSYRDTDKSQVPSLLTDIYGI